MGAARHRDHVSEALREGELPLRRGGPHESPALVFTEAGRTKTVTLTDAEAAEVAAAVARYQDAKAELERAADAGIAELRSRLAARRGQRR